MSTDQVISAKHSAGDMLPGIAQKMISDYNDRTDFSVIDVSTPWEFTERHLEHAINISFLSPSFKSRIGRLEKNHVYLLYCKVGGRSKMAQALMRKIGFKKVYNLVGGTLLWEDEGLPLIESGKKSIFSFCPVAFSVKGLRKIRRFLGQDKDSPACSDVEAHCRCDGISISRNGRRWQDCCRSSK